MTIEAAGEMMTGGLIARAVEPMAGEDTPGADGLTHEHACLNCRTVLVGGYCHACGQHAHVHRTLGALAHDLLHGVFHFEGKVWRTIPMLFWNPGALTRRYIHGERARFVSPLALFLFSVFLMFATFESVGGPVQFNGSGDGSGVNAAVVEMSAERDAATKRIDALITQRGKLAVGDPAIPTLDAKIAKERDDRDGLNSALNGIANGLDVDEDISTRAKIDTGSKALDNQIKKALKNPKLLLYKLQSSAYKFSWALIPLSLPLIWLMFAWKPAYKLYDHAVFVTYSITFVMLLLVAMALTRTIGLNLSAAILFVPIHFFWQLRTAYQLKPLSALWRSIVLIVVTTFVLIAFGALLLVLGLSG